MIAPPKFPSHVSKSLKSFLTCCLQKDPLKRLSAIKLLEHPFINSNVSQHVEMCKDSEACNKILNEKAKCMNPQNSLIPSFHNLNSVEKITKKFSSNFKKIHILEKENEIKEKESTDLLQAHPINILAKNESVPDLFSVSMSVSQDMSRLPELLVITNNNALKENIKNYNNNKSEKEIINHQNNQINNDIFILEELKVSNSNTSINSYKELEKLKTLNMKKEDFEELERHFRESNTKVSLPPIKKD
jgi:serine/threonine protein kinase